MEEMKIKLRAVKDSGDLPNERVVLKALRDDDIGHYVLFDTTYTQSGAVSNKMRHPYWLPDMEVSEGDLIVIYTKAGVDKTTTNSSGTTVHFVYRGLEKTIWNMGGDCAVLMDIREWETVGV